MSTFTPTSEWQDVPDDAVLPPGCQININLSTGRKQARWPNGNGHAEPEDGDDFCDEPAWPEPIPLFAEHERPELYPLDALPPTIRGAVESYQRFGQQPVELVACSALGAASLACQGLADVDRDGGNLSGPCSLSFMTVAVSGERKTACDRRMRRALSEWEAAKRQEQAPAIKAAERRLAIWQTRRDGILTKLKRLAGSTKPDDEHDRRQLESLLLSTDSERPELPTIVRLFFEDVTPEKLASALSVGWPSASLWSDEAGLVIGSHALSEDSAMRFLTLLNRLWDANSFTRDRETRSCAHVRGRRFTTALMLQPSALAKLTAAGDGIARGVGALARFLLAWPSSTMGTRAYRAGDMDAPELRAFDTRIKQLLDTPLPLDDDGTLQPPSLRLSREAFELWRELHDDVEREIGRKGEFSELPDFGAKIAEQAARIACVLHILERGPDGQISADMMLSGARERVVVGGEHELAIQLLGTTDLGAVDVGPTLAVLREIGAEALGGDQAAGGLGVVAGETVELELQEVEDRRAVALLPLGLIGVQAQDVASAPLALADHHLLGAQVRRDLGVAPGAAQDLVFDLLHAADRRRQDVATGTPAELLEIGPGVEPGIAHEQRAAEPQLAQIVLDPLHGRDVGGIAGQNPGAHRHAIAGHGERDDHLRVVVTALLGVPALSQRREGQPPPLFAGCVLLVAFEPGGGGIIEDQVDLELEQIDAVPEHLVLDRIAVLGQDIQRPIELVEGKIPGRRQPDAIEPALVAGDPRVKPEDWPGEALRGHRRQRGLVRCVSLTGRQPRGDRSADAEPGPQLLDHMDDTELEARLDLDRPRATRLPCGGLATVGLEHAADAAHQPLQRGAVEAIGAPEAVHHPGLNMALLGMADVLGERVVADDRAVLVAPLRGAKIHAHAFSVCMSPRRAKSFKSCAHTFSRRKRPPAPKSQ